MVVKGVHLIDCKDGGFLRLTQQMCHFGIKLGDTLVNVYHEQHNVCFLDCEIDLTIDFSLEDIFRVDYPTAGVNHRKILAIPFRTAILAVTRGARFAAYNCPPCFRKTVEKGRFPDIRTTHDG